MKKLIVTVGPSLLKYPLPEIHDETIIYRINGAHCTVDGAAEYTALIRSQLPDADILLDLPGNKIRTANLKKPIEVRNGQKFEVSANQTNYAELYTHLKAGDVVLADDSTLKFVVDCVSEKAITLLSFSDGQLRNNKGLHVRGIHEGMPFLFRKDIDLIRKANSLKISHIGLSFVRNAQDIDSAKKLIDPGITIISKVETRAAVENINEILKTVDHILVDRGDLSTDIGVEKIPAYQRFIVDKANFFNKKVFLSTQFLKNMEEKPIPTIAELIDLYNTFKMGVYGIQLSEETSVGKYPKECLDVVRSVLRQIASETK